MTLFLSSTSNIRISIPGRGTPAAPATRLSVMGVDVPEGEVSVIPQPSSRRHPVTRWNLSWTSTGKGAPPEAQNLREERSNFAMSGWLAIAIYMVGTPGKTVGFFLLKSFITASSSNFGCRMISEPPAMPKFMITVSAYIWKSGSTASTFSVPSTRTGSSPCCMALSCWHAAIRFLWVSIAPFGNPVVPPVYCRTATFSEGFATGAASPFPSLANSCLKVICWSSSGTLEISFDFTIG